MAIIIEDTMKTVTVGGKTFEIADEQSRTKIADHEQRISDIEEGTAKNVYIDTTANWNAQADLIGQEGYIYVYTDYETIDGTVIPAVKIGDGKAYLIDAPYVDGNATALLKHVNNSDIHITAEERAFWNEKVRCFISQANAETIVFSTT